MSSDFGETVSAFRPTRRQFGRGLLATAALVAVPGVRLADAAPGFTPYRIDHGPDVSIDLTTGHAFSLSVKANGREIERFDNVTGSSIHTLRSAYFTVSAIPIPTAA